MPSDRKPKQAKPVKSKEQLISKRRMQSKRRTRQTTGLITKTTGTTGPITKTTLIGEIINKYPEAAAELSGFGFYCVGCYIATWETVEQAAELHGINADKLVAELNAKVVDTT